MAVKFILRHLKDSFVEFIKYDFNEFKQPLVLLARSYCFFLQKNGNHSKAFNIASAVYRTGWANSYELGVQASRYYLDGNVKQGTEIIKNMLENIPRHERTASFFKDPAAMLDGIVSVLKSPSRNEKGALLINYSYYFPLFLKFFDVPKIQEQYNIILEPSWAGFCELPILAYAQLPEPVFIQTYESRDLSFIKEVSREKLIPIEVGPSWFINHYNFAPPAEENKRDIDLIMIATWATFKRHRQFFSAIHKLVLSKKLNITLVGYPGDMTKEQVYGLARHYGIEHAVTMCEWIEPQEVAALLRRSKINVLWSKFEGNNRAIIEGMFCNTPAILRRGHNYGEHYDFINSQTGAFADESDLHSCIDKLLHSKDLRPREYVMKHRNCVAATQIMDSVIKEYELSKGRDWTGGMAVKVNELHAMKYIDDQYASQFLDDYSKLKNCIIEVVEND